MSLVVCVERDDAAPVTPTPTPDAGLRALCGIAAFYRIAADPTHLQRELALSGREAGVTDLMRASGIIGLKARRVARSTEKQLAATPTPAIARLREGGFAVFGGRLPDGRFRLVDPVTSIDRAVSAEEFLAAVEPEILLVGRRAGGAGYDPKSFGFRWFLPSIWRYRRPLMHVLLASLFVQVFALVTPLFFQVVVDKVLSHKGYSTLIVLTVGIVLVGLFDVVLQYLRTYALTHTTNRIDVELGQRLFRHLLHLPLSYFETRAAGQTVARVRELENVRAFLTGQGLFSALDLVFTVVFIAVLFAYSWKLTIIVVLSIPLYMLVALGFRPILQEMVREKFNASAASQQFLVEAVVGIQTVKASAVEPIMQQQWEERLASYVRQSFSVTILSAIAQNGVTYISRLTTALLMLFGAKAVIDGELSIGALVAFNMISAQVTAPVLRLSQLYQDFQQVQISVERLGDVLNAPAEPAIRARTVLPPPRGLIEFRNVSFRYRPGSNDVVKGVDLRDPPRRGGGHRGAVGLRQVDADQADPAALHAAGRADPARRRRPHPGRPRLAAHQHRRGAAGEPAVQPHHPREHRLRGPRHAARPGDRHRAAVGRRRVHRQAAGRLRHGDRGARRQPVGRPAPAHRHRAGAGHQPADPDLRRGDERARLRERAGDPDQHAPDRAQPHRHHHRAPLGGGAALRPHHRHGGRPRDRGRRPRRADRPAGRPLSQAVDAAERAGAGMSALPATTTPKPPAPRRIRLSRGDHEFLPGALEILETPLSPVRSGMILTICAFAVVALVWSWFGRVDIIATAQGKIQPVGRTKTIQPLETGKVASVAVENGDARQGGRRAGAARPGRSAGRRGRARGRHRVRDGRGAAPHGRAGAGLRPRAGPGAADRLRRRRAARRRGRASSACWQQDIAQLAGTVGSLDGQVKEKTAERDRLQGTIDAQQSLVATLKERVDMRQTLEASKSESRAKVIDALELMQTQAATLAGERGQIGEIAASLGRLGRDIEKSYAAFSAENAQKLADAERLMDENVEKLAKARLKTADMTLRSPIDGTVSGSTLTSVGQVLSVGEQVMQIVPSDSKLEIECYLPNSDIGFVRKDQQAVVKIDSFPFTDYGTIDGRVTRVAHDAIPQPDADQREQNPAQASKEGGLFGGGQRFQNLVFPVTLTLDRAVMKTEDAAVPLLPGMAVTVEIKTGTRRILSYLFSPILQVTTTAFRER